MDREDRRRGSRTRRRDLGMCLCCTGDASVVVGCGRPGVELIGCGIWCAGVPSCEGGTPGVGV